MNGRPMRKDLPARPTDRIEDYIYTVRGQRVILDADLAALYGVTTKRLNEQGGQTQCRSDSHDDFVFQLTAEELESIRLPNLVPVPNRWNMRPFHRSIAILGISGMRLRSTARSCAANVLNSPRAAQMSVVHCASIRADA